MSFKDHFSTQSTTYAQSRPTYPDALFEYLAAQAPARHCALDVATGNGQAAIGLAKYFDQVIGIDASQNQIDQAQPAANVTYHCAPADQLPVEDGTVDLITIAQALHWLPLDAFYAEVRRVARPGAVIAAISYGLNSFNDPAIDGPISELYGDVLGDYWPPERRHVENGYRDLAFPFSGIAPPVMAIEREWSLDILRGYLESWSATQRYIRAVGNNPVDDLMNTLSAIWDKNSTKKSQFPLTLKLGYVA